MRTFAAIVVGSFDVELGIYEISAKQPVHRIDYIRHRIALEKHTYREGKISYRLVEELCRVLKSFTEAMAAYQVDDYRAYATSAVRGAKNNRIVLEQIRVRTGLHVQIISNSEQRFINCKAIAAKDSEFQRLIQNETMIADAGFGSIQLSLYDAGVLICTQNIPMGILRMRETMGQLKELPEMDYALLEELIRNEMITFRKLYLKGRNVTNLILVGDILASMIGRLKKEDKLRGKVSSGEFFQFCEKLRGLSLSETQRHLEIDAEYARLMVSAVIIYKQVLETNGAKTIWLPGICLMDGIAAEYAIEQRILKLDHDFENDIIVAARNIARRYRCHMIHVQTVETMALAIFDASKKIHGMKVRERLLLQIAAILHECGKFISVRNTAECCYNIIMSTELIGISHIEREIVANAVRYRIEEFEYNEIIILNKTLPGTNILIAKLTAILRLAKAMDSSQKQKMEPFTVRVREKELVMVTETFKDIRLEELSVNSTADFFEEIFGIRPVLKQKRSI